MEIIIGKKVGFKVPKDSYTVTIITSESHYGDHEIKINFNNDNDGLRYLRELIICLEICSKQFPDGKMITSSYDGVPYFDKYLSNRWFVEKTPSFLFYDYLKGYKVRYYDNNGESYKVDITNDPEMIEIIKNFKTMMV